MSKIEFFYSDGGRFNAGFKGHASDCVCRAISIATNGDYATIYARLAAGNATQRKGKRNGRSHGKKTAQEGIMTQRKWFKDYMHELGFTWVSCMGVGTGCKVHVAANELPAGKLVLALSRHFAAVVDGVLFDTHDSSRGGTRCVYGYYKLN